MVASNGNRKLHYSTVAKALREGRVVPLLGAGVHLCGRVEGERWKSGSSRLPTGAELARFLAREFELSELIGRSEREDLGRVAQTVATINGSAWLYDKLHAIFDLDYEPTAMHRFLAQLPAKLRASRSPAPHQLILTTNYDDTLERAFREAEEPYDLVRYSAERDPWRGTFWHWPPPQDETLPTPIEKPNEYDAISLDTRTVILKFHGAVDRTEASRDSYVITEDNYIDFLARTQVSNLIPAKLVAKLRHSHFLFLAYALRDWNVRVLLHRLWLSQRLDYPSWAIQRNAHLVDERLWQRRDVEIIDVDLDLYVRELSEYMKM
jgi:hypothetical protein